MTQLIFYRFVSATHHHFCWLFMFIDAKGLSNPSEVELLREKVYAALEAYCKQRYPDQQGRYRMNKESMNSSDFLC